MQDILQGMLIFNKYEPDCDMAAEHDEIFCGGLETKKNATKEEKKQLKDLGWMWREEFECYYHFT